MAKYTSADVSRIAARLRRARNSGRPAHFLIGAGCSMSAGIPLAGELIAKIREDFPEEYRTLKKEEQRASYGACMSLLSINERRDLIRPYLDKAKINWGTIALAQLIGENFVERVLTLNFDLVLENACGLLGLQPAVYDFGVAPAKDPAMIVSPAIVHLHGQSYGLVRLNTDKETDEHRKKLHPILVDTLRRAPLVIVGYSGSADGISRTLLEEFEGRDPLYWIGYEEELDGHLHAFKDRNYFQFIGGADFDRFMIELAQSLQCWPPALFTKPLDHLHKGLGPIVPYPAGDSDDKLDLLGDLRRTLESLQKKLTETEDEAQRVALKEMYMKGNFEGAAKLFSAWGDRMSPSDEDREIAYWSYLAWGSSLSEQAESAGADDAEHLFGDAGDKYQQALAIRPDKHEALYNWGNLLSVQAKRASGTAADHLFVNASHKYAEALAIKPDKHEALFNWGNLLWEEARRTEGVEAIRLFAAADQKYAAALAIKPDKHGAIYNAGLLRLDQAKRTTGEDAAHLLAEAQDKLDCAAELDPTETFNLACVAALRGDEQRCREALENAEKRGTLPSLEHLASDADLNSMRDKPWFKELLGRQKAKTGA